MKFGIRALSPDQGVSQLVIEAQDEADARKQVAERGLFVSAIAPQGGALGGLMPGRSASGVSGFSLVLFSQELLALLKAGLGIVETLEALIEKEANPNLRPVLLRLLGGLRDGKRFSVVLAEQPLLFPPLYIGVIKAAEGTSDLPRSLERFISYQERIDAVRNKVVSAAIYPAILMSVGGAVSFFLMAFVVPKFAEVYQGTGREMPWMSKLMLSWGEFASSHTQTLLIGLGLVVGAAVLGYRRFVANGGVVRLLSRLPGVGERVRVYELSRLYLTLGMLLEGGIPLIPAMDTIRAVVSVTLEPRLKLAKEMIESGMPFSEAFQVHGLTTPISLRMLSVGERSGELGPMLTQSAEFYDGEITRWIERFMRSFEPLLMAAIGLVVGVIVILLYMPIFDLAGSF
jgi:general secretion pathway protein F